jgi:hypothetical protein
MPLGKIGKTSFQRYKNKTGEYVDMISNYTTLPFYEKIRLDINGIQPSQ